MQRNKNERYVDFAIRCTQAVVDGLIDREEWSKSLIGEVRYAEENLRRGFNLCKQILENVDNDEIENGDAVDRVAEIKAAKDELEKERIKLQTANLEYNAAKRAEARNDLFNEQLIDAVGRLEPIERYESGIMSLCADVGTTALLAISDLHAGSNFVIHGLYDEVVNQYSFDIMKARLYEIIQKLVNDDIAFDDMTVAFCGDMFEGILRESSLLKLREPVVDTVIRLSEFLAHWLVDLSLAVNTRINVVTVGGNHDIVRNLTSRPCFDGENLTKIVVEFLKLRLGDFEWISVDDYQDVAIKTIRGTNIMFNHGDDKNLKTTMDYFENLYNVDVDEIIAGHMHRPESKSVGITDVGDKTLTRVGSIVGVDSFAKSIRVSARPSAYVAMYTDDGKTWSRNYYL